MFDLVIKVKELRERGHIIIVGNRFGDSATVSSLSTDGNYLYARYYAGFRAGAQMDFDEWVYDVTDGKLLHGELPSMR